MFSSSNFTKEEIVYLTKLCEHSERFNDMKEYIKLIATNVDEELSIEQRNLFSVAYKNIIGPKRLSYQTICNIYASYSETDQQQYLQQLKQYKEKIREEIIEICNEILQILDNQLAKKQIPDAEVFYYKLKCDFLIYLSGVVKQEQQIKIFYQLIESYTIAFQLICSYLKSTDPIRLHTALRLAIFHSQYLNDFKKAINIAQESFINAINDFDQINYQQQVDIEFVMKELQDKIFLWKEEQTMQ